MTLKKNNGQGKKKDNLLNPEKKKRITKSNVLKQLSKDKSDIFDSEIEQILDKKLNDKEKKNDKLFLENQFKFDSILNRSKLKKSIRNFTF